MNNVNDQISRMKAMMTYGLKTESKNTSYSGLEYNRLGADGKTYGIVREGTKFYIKVANKTNNVLVEDFDYIGGFRNRKDYEYPSYASALKNFEMKMSSIKEANNNKAPIIESWNPDKKEMLAVEATDKMRREIDRQRQIMHNTALIQEKKNYEAVLTEKSCVDKDCLATQKDNIKKTSDGIGDPKGNGGDPFKKSVNGKQKNSQKNNVKKEFKPVMENDNVLGWNDDKDYLDTSSSTEVGDDAPFTEKCCDKCKCDVTEETAMHNSDNQNSPEVGVNEVGDDAPFTVKLKESDDFENDDDSELDTDDTLDSENDFDSGFESDDDSELDTDDTLDSEEDFDDTDELESDVDELESDDENLESRLSYIEDLLDKIADKLDVTVFDDDKLYDDDEPMDDEDLDEPMDDEDLDEPMDDEDSNDTTDDEDDFEVYESINYRKLMKEDNLDYFGKHPAYRKEPMDLPSSSHQEMQDYYDMNDDSVDNEEPYGKEVGDSAPFEIDVEKIENAIAESIKRVLKKKI